MNTFSIQLGTNPAALLTCYLHDHIEPYSPAQRPAMIMCPGGAYEFLNPDEGAPKAMAFFARGYNVFVLEYSLGLRAMWPQTLCDAGLAIKTIRENAEAWHIYPNRIAIMGFSAGGSMAINAGTMWNLPEVQEALGAFNGENRPDAVIPVYPAAIIDMPAIIDGRLAVVTVNPCEHISADSSPAFLVHTYGDTMVSMMHSIRIAEKYSEHHVPVEMHVYAFGDHGSLNRGEGGKGANGETEPGYFEFFGRCCAWLDDIFALNGKYEKARSHAEHLGCSIYSGDMTPTPADAPEVSIYTKLSVFAKNPAAMAIIYEYIPALRDITLDETALNLPLRKWLYFAGFAVADMIVKESDPGVDECIERLKNVIK